MTITLAPRDGGTEVTLRHANPGRELAPLVFAGHRSCIVADGERDMPDLTLTRPSSRQLDPFVGAWKMTGHSHESPFGPEAEVAATETFEWLTGRQFLMHRLQGQLGDEEIGCVEVLGRESGGDGFSAHTFYNDGTSTRWGLEERDGAWIMSGQWPKGREVFQVRCTISFDDRTHRRSVWEYSTDGSGWQVFWETDSTRKK